MSDNVSSKAEFFTYKLNLHVVIIGTVYYALSCQKAKNQLMLVPDVIDLPGTVVVMCV